VGRHRRAVEGIRKVQGGAVDVIETDASSAVFFLLAVASTRNNSLEREFL
jgi:5-enolpyruvylshikimate-3-phosphate synthase